MTFPRAADADIALLLEGTFPFVSGGVSSWVNQIIRAFPELRFAIVFLGSRKEDYGEPKYALPDNVVHLETHYLYEFANKEATVKEAHDRFSASISKDLVTLHEMIKNGRDENAGNLAFHSLSKEI